MISAKLSIPGFLENGCILKKGYDVNYQYAGSFMFDLLELKHCTYGVFS